MTVALPQGFHFNEEQPFTELLRILSRDASVQIYGSPGDATTNHQQTRQDSWQVMLPDGSTLDNALHAATQILYELKLDHLEETLRSMHDGAALPLMKVLDNVRTAMLSNARFNKRHTLDAALANGMDWRSPYATSDASRHHLVTLACNAVWATALGQDATQVCNDPFVLEIAGRYAERIQQAVLSPNAGDMVSVVVDLVAEFNVGPDPTEPGDEPGDGDGDSGDDDSTPGDGEGNGAGSSAGEQEGQGDGGSGDGNSASQQPPPPTREERVQKARSRVKSNLKRADNRIEKHATPNRNPTGDKKIGRTAYGTIGEHRVKLEIVPTEPIVLSEQGRLLARDYSGGGSVGSFSRTGTPTTKVWQMGLGNTRVFRSPPPQRGKVAMLLDMSGSMGCWCSGCNRQRRYQTDGYMMMQVAGVLAECNDEALVAGYCDQQTIVPLTGGQQPICKYASGLGGGTPTCVGLDWMRSMLGTEADGALAVLITDGSPSSCSGGHYPASHTKQLANEMYQSGMRFAVVLVGTPETGAAELYPAAITATVTSLSDLRNVQVILDTL